MSLTNSQYDAIMRQYDAKQSRNRELVRKKQEELYARDPRFAEIEKKIGEVSLAQAKKLLAGDDKALVQLKAQLAELAREREVLYSDLGVSAADFEMSYTCPDCRDTGFIDGQKCHCFRQAAIDMLYTQSNIRRVLEEENFNHFSFKYYSKDLRHPVLEGMSAYSYAVHTVKYCRDYIENFDHSGENILFQGSVGTGKTFLSHCIAKELIESGHSVIYFSAHDLFDVFRKQTFDKDNDAHEQADHIFDCDLLIIDDLGSEFRNSFTVSQLFLLINERLMRKKSMIISTNLTPEQLVDEYSERTASRILSNFSSFMLVGEDIRLQKKAENFGN